jgi:hypothetical protein
MDYIVTAITSFAKYMADNHGHRLSFLNKYIDLSTPPPVYTSSSMDAGVKQKPNPEQKSGNKTGDV